MRGPGNVTDTKRPVSLSSTTRRLSLRVRRPRTLTFRRAILYTLDKHVALLNQIRDNRETAKKDRRLPQFIDGEYAEAETYADKALKSFIRGEIRKTKVFFYAAHTYRDKAERDVKDAKELGEKLAEMLKAS